MNFLNNAAPVNRRQFGMMTGGAAVLLAGVAYGAITITEGSAETSVRTAFGKVSVLRAGRLPRLDAQGHSPAINHMTAASVFNGRRAADAGGVRDGDALVTSDGHGHGDALQNAAWPQPINLTWGDVLVLEAEIHNESPEPVLFSPAQLRLKLAQSGTTVTPKDFDRSPGTLQANAGERIRISYLVPHSANDFELEFSDGAHESVLRLAMPPVRTIRAFT